MRFASISLDGGPAFPVVVCQNGKAEAIQSSSLVGYRSIADLIQGMDNGLDPISVISGRLADGLEGSIDLTAENVEFQTPLLPWEIRCIGKNYKKHVEGGGESSMPPIPIQFMKSRGSVVGSGAEIVVPGAMQEPDYEGELAVVIGKSGKDITVENAWEHVLFYTAAHDVSGRDWQLGPAEDRAAGKRYPDQWIRGKGPDTFTPFGPFLLTRAELPKEPGELQIQTLLNGEVVQDTHGKEPERMHFDIPAIIAHISEGTTLRSGTLILCGTPSGTQIEQTEPKWLQDGDEVTVRIEGIGDLKNKVVRTA